ncbi:hypothetical protein QBC38DRAFT_493568 [Podospora fimiseda]|uniref:C2H2-type domain-containing protein n=1 Tax=Podospora fimiseda TaxID=252190 RepID=A0AAN7BEE8_9PEZI|nr:hypothetical protein QBC38DRAFT_493568 [Podospora fimiseda]
MSQPRSQFLSRYQFSVAWISALPIELAAAKSMLDTKYAGHPTDLDCGSTSQYTLGRIGEHDVVLASLPVGQMGTNSAAVVASSTFKDFPLLKFCLMVGIGGGVPSSKADIRLGDIVVSLPSGTHGGVIQYDFGRTRPEGFERTGFLNAPPQVLLQAVGQVRADHLGSNTPGFMSHLSDVTERVPGTFARQMAGPDRLFQADYKHEGGDTCDSCRQEYQVQRPWRGELEVKVHYGTIASGNQVMRDGRTRDKLSSELGGVLCFEMEAAGLMNSFQCLVIRGICDYSDSHKNKDWQPYAAATAAAYAKELLESIVPLPSNFSSQISTIIEDPLVPLPEIKPEFEKVINEFKSASKLPNAELRVFEFTSLGNLEACMALMQQKQAQAKRLRYMKRLEPFLEGVKELAKVLDVLIGNSDSILAFIWDPMKSILQSSSTFDDAFDSILDVYETIGSQIPVLSGYQSKFNNKPHIQSVLVMIYQDILSFQLEALRYFEQKSWRHLFNSTWKDFPWTIKRLEDNFSCHRRLILGTPSLTELEQIRHQRRLEEAAFEERRRAEFDRRKRAVVQWLSPADSATTHEKHQAARANTLNSGQWLLNHRRFQDWFDPKYCQTPLLWMNGKPGAGKTVLASRIIDEVKSLKDVSLAYFYCNETDPTRNTFLSVARGLLAQLLPHDESLLLHMDKKRQEGTDPILSRPGVAKDFLRLALKRRKSYVIIDGIDECVRDQRKYICSFFEEVVNSLPKKNMDEIRCLLVSQDDGIARKDLSKLPVLSVKKEDNHCDIEAFSKYWQLEIEKKFKGRFPKDVLDIANLVTERAQGIFIFAKCVLEELYKQTTRDALLKEWNDARFPKDLDEVFQRIFDRIFGTDSEVTHEVTKKLLGWISYAKRPLRWHEIQAAISLNLEDGTINNENLRSVNSAKEHCQSFVEEHPDQTVAFVHPTVKDFLLRHEIINKGIAHHQLCSLSIQYLGFSAMDVKNGDDDIEEALVTGQYAFYEYAVANWVPHLISWLPDAKTDEVPQLRDHIETLLETHYSKPPETDKFELSKTMEDKLRILRSLSCYDSLVQTIIWSRKLLLIDNKDHGSEAHQVLDFPSITMNIQKVLERLSEFCDDETKELLEKYYGIDLFRCSKVYCQHFYKGFSNREDRDKHVSRHDRPHRCSIEGCPRATFGYASKAELQKHGQEIHGDEPEFPNLPTVSKDEVNKRKTYNPTRYQCDRCPKMFTGKHNLNSHIRAHNGERPYACKFASCQKRFNRNSDKNRHEKTCKKGAASG